MQPCSVEHALETLIAVQQDAACARDQENNEHQEQLDEDWPTLHKRNPADHFDQNFSWSHCDQEIGEDGSSHEAGRMVV